MEQTEKKKRRFVNRILFAVVIALSVWTSGLFPPVMPHIQLPAEPVHHHPLFVFADQDFYITNTMVAVWIAVAINLIIGWNIRRQLKQGKMVLSGVSGAIASLLEGFYNMTKATAGKWAKKIFPYFATIFLLVLFVNLMELVPGVDTIGYIHESEHGTPVQELTPWLATIVKADATEDTHGEEADTHGYGLVPYVRVASTDLNFTLSLALISVVMTQVIGLQALGRGYLSKYWNGKDVAKAWKEAQFGNPMDFIIGLVKWFASVLEIIAEISKILSFTFRLFGVIFAGSVLLFFIGSMVPVFAQSLVVFLELLFGPLQALVFGMLTMMFMAMATVSHDHGDEHH